MFAKNDVVASGNRSNDTVIALIVCATSTGVYKCSFVGDAGV